MKKLYFVFRRIYPDSEDVQGFLFDEKGYMLNSWLSSDLRFLEYDLIDRNSNAAEWRSNQIIGPMSHVDYLKLTKQELL